MKFLFVGLFGLTVVTAVYSKIIFEKYNSEFNPNYLTLKLDIKEVGGDQFVNLDVDVLKGSVIPPLYTIIIHKKDDGDYQEVLRLGPFDPCTEDLTSDPTRQQHHEEMMKHGNASLNQICPFQKGYLYLRDWKLDISEQLPPHMPKGSYMIEIKSTVQEGDNEVMVMDGDLFITIE